MKLHNLQAKNNIF